MFKLFTRKKPDAMFRARAPERDHRSDALRIASISDSIEDALQASRTEHAGLERRLNDVLARAAMTLGNDADEYLDREPANTELQNVFSFEIANGERRLRDLETNIRHFEALKAALEASFPHHKNAIATNR
ncbi:hypothetical protein [Rhodopseudomonas telluris]|uniref:Uncharacterized protein n=1 Tax=Rhodopseudomonas telluris TaxID=644215 RepID=A0ABV6EVU9_9BRAD